MGFPSSMNPRVTSRTMAVVLAAVSTLYVAFQSPAPPQEVEFPLQMEQGATIALIGNNLCARMMNTGHFETAVQLRHPGKQLRIRNLCDAGNTPGFRPHPGRPSPWAFPGAEQFYTNLARESGSEGHFETPDEWLMRLQADIVIGFFGYNESFQGAAGLDTYRAELEAFIDHTLAQRYNGEHPPRLVLVSPTAFEDLSATLDLPSGDEENEHLAMYTEAMREIAGQYDEVLFVDAFAPSQRWQAESETPLTIDGVQLTGPAYERLAELLAGQIFASSAAPEASAHRSLVREAVMDKNWHWENNYKIPNGVHVFGRRYNPYGPDNYPYELKKIRQMTAIRDTAIWRAARGRRMDVAAADARTIDLPPVQTNYQPSSGAHGDPEYLYGEEALETLETAPGYRIEAFATEQDFEALANPVQLSFDNEGRLWVATMPSYPHWKPGDGRPNDKLLILEDTDGDHRADRQIIFADSLHLPVGFELSADGVYVSQGTDLVLLKDTNGDDRADERHVILSGFDDHDTHHAHSAYTADPSGAIYMGEGTFLHTNVETSYGPVRATNGGFYRYNPQRRRLERTAQLAIPNPWGIAFDRWGQNFYAETSSPVVSWMMPGTIKPLYGVASPKSRNLIEEDHMVRPTSGLEFVSSRHFPDEAQGDMLINNTIGFLGTKQHNVEDAGTGFMTHHQQDLVWGSDPNFRPVDMEFAPDGSLYLVDWHNVLIGHMQHNARDPLRDHVHGRIYRITYPSRPLVEEPAIAGAPIEVLLENLKLPEYRARYRTRRELRGRDAADVLPKLQAWVENLDADAPQHEHHLLEALWVTWGLNEVDTALLRQLLEAEDVRARAAAVRVLRYTGHQVENQTELLAQAARDEHGRVRLEAIVAASWLDREAGMRVLNTAAEKPLDEWMEPAHAAAVAHLNGRAVGEEPGTGEPGEEVPSEVETDEVATDVETDLVGEERARFALGKEVYNREGGCVTCHQADGGGLSASGFPPLTGTRWVHGSEERLIKLVLKGLQGPIVVNGETYPGQVPMTAFEGLLTDEEVAAVLTYVRNAFGNEASAITPETVRTVREAIRDKEGFYTADELLQEHPFEDSE
jgi:mono/diheme cytochrome c family protein/glucose/arabinose dehydrogenase